MLRNPLRMALLAAVLLLAAGTSVAGDLTVDQIIAKTVEARGGMEAIKAIETVRIQGKMSMQGMEAPVQMEWKRPDKMRLEFTIQGMTGIQSVDGDAGWAVMPFMGKTEAEPMADDQLKQAKDMADFDGELVDYKEKGHTVELVGEVEVEGTPAYQLKVTKSNGDVTNVYVDAEYFLVFRDVGKRSQQGVEMEFATNYGDYKEVDGVLFWHSMEVGSPDGTVFQTVTLETIETGVEFADDLFTMPEPSAAPADAAAGDGE